MKLKRDDLSQSIRQDYTSIATSGSQPPCKERGEVVPRSKIWVVGSDAEKESGSCKRSQIFKIDCTVVG